MQREFREDEKMTIYNIQLNMYSLNIINYIISEAESMNLTIRTIKGVRAITFPLIQIKMGLLRDILF